MGKLLSMLVVQLCFKLSHIIIRFGGSRSCGFFVELEAKCCGVIRKE
jgi:hypothetical protein